MLWLLNRPRFYTSDSLFLSFVFPFYTQVLKDTLAECVANDVLNACNASSTAARSRECGAVASPTHRGRPGATLHHRHRYAPRELLRVDGGQTCFKVRPSPRRQGLCIVVNAFGVI
jgi:hypothetical protein